MKYCINTRKRRLRQIGVQNRAFDELHVPRSYVAGYIFDFPARQVIDHSDLDPSRHTRIYKMASYKTASPGYTHFRQRSFHQRTTWLGLGTLPILFDTLLSRCQNQWLGPE